MRTREEIAKMGLSSDCTLDPLVVMAIMLGGREHPCDGCNMDRGKCRGYAQPGRKEEARDGGK
jgi:hypothetical protein